MTTLLIILFLIVSHIAAFFLGVWANHKVNTILDEEEWHQRQNRFIP